MEINLKNVEQIIFFDKKMREILPEFKHFFDQWNLGKMIPALSEMGSKSVLDLLNSLDTNHIQKLENYFGDSVIVNKINYNIVKSHEMLLGDSLCGFVEYKDFCVHRNKENLSLTFWR